MKAYRSMVLVSSDPKSIKAPVKRSLLEPEAEIKTPGLQDEISLSMVTDVDRHDAIPLVIVYPEAVIYGPVKLEDVPVIVEEHLYKGRIVSNLVASTKELSGRIAWLSARQGTLPAEKRIVTERARIDRSGESLMIT